MRIGIDVTFATGGFRTGLYYHLRHLVAELGRLAPGPSLVVNATGRVDRQQRAHIRADFPDAPVRFWRRPGRLSRVLSWLSPLRKLDVLCHSQGGHLPPLRRGANVYFIPDLIPITLPFYGDGHRRFLSAFCDEARTNGDAILVYSEYVKGQVVKMLGIEADRIRVTPLAAGPQFRPLARQAIQPALARAGLASTPYLLYVSTLEPRKGHVNLLRAFARLLRREPALPHRLVLVGARWMGEEAIFAAIRTLGVEDRVVYLGYVDELEALVNGADLFVFPSLAEGFGLPPLEAMACGTPVVCSDATSLPEVVGDAGLLVPPEDEEAWCEAMRRTLTDRTLHGTLREKGLRRAASFTWQRTAQETLAGCELACTQRGVVAVEAQ
jgi:glycosyltransferase involved in cell wall biosynthesis